jgi:uncharacterized membrane protein YhaH (DUF805 family)
LRLYCCGIVIPDLGMKTRRLHDVGKSGWWFLIALVPFGAGYLIYLWSQPSKRPSQSLAETFA